MNSPCGGGILCHGMGTVGEMGSSLVMTMPFEWICHGVDRRQASIPKDIEEWSLRRVSTNMLGTRLKGVRGRSNTVSKCWIKGCSRALKWKRRSRSCNKKKPKMKAEPMMKMWSWAKKKKDDIKGAKQRRSERCLKISKLNDKKQAINKVRCRRMMWQEGYKKQRSKVDATSTTSCFASEASKRHAAIT